MTNVGDKVKVGTICDQTGRYGHTARLTSGGPCPNTIILNKKGDKVPPCGYTGCGDKGADWKLLEKLT